MSDYDDDEFEDESDEADETPARDSKLVKDLRKQLRAHKKAMDEQATELATYRTQQRKSTVAELLKAAGTDTEYAKFYQSDDASETAVQAWIQENRKLLGIRDPEPEDPQADQVRQFSDVLNSAPQVKPGSHADSLEKLRNTKTREEHEAAIAAAFRTTLPGR
jgi:hypothetical protein